MQHFEKRSSGGAVIAYPGPMSPTRSARREGVASGGRARHGEGGATAIVMPDGFEYLTGSTMLGAPDEVGASRNGLDVDAWWLAVTAALSWLSTQIVEGFALSAAVTHSEFIWPLGDYDSADERPSAPVDARRTDRSPAAARAEHEPAHEPAHEVVRYLPLHGVRETQPAGGGDPRRRGSSTDLSHQSDPSWSQWTISIFAALRSRVLRHRDVSRMKTAWQAIDERTLKDIGLSRYDVGLIVGDGRRWD